ncbi:MAG: type II toxin-antitoxin system Phd/YefM family antitoxin [Sporichthyaceae bacterium]
MSTVSLRELRDRLGAIVRDVAFTGHEVVITDNGREVAVIIGLEDYERLHEHADVADALRVRRQFVSRAKFVAGSRTAPDVDPAQFRADREAVVDNGFADPYAQ